MYYETLASELLKIKAHLLQVPASQQMDTMVKGELFVLNYLSTHKEIVHPKELSENMSVSTARIAALLNHMEKKELISRSPDPADNRQIIVQLTPNGTRAIEEKRAEVLRYAAAMLESLGPDDAREYIRIQEKIIRNFQK